MLSYSGRFTALFGFVAIMTAIISLFVLAFVWEDHFSTYENEFSQRIANSAAETLSSHYEEFGRWDDIAEATLAVSDESVSIAATDADGNMICGNSALPSDSKGVVRATIFDGDRAIGQVVVWSKGPTGLMSEFRDSTFYSVMFASLVAVVISLLIGLVVSRGITRPIKRITETADEIKKGNLAARTGLEGFDEISQLGMTIDDMAASIQNDRELERRLTNDVAHELRTPLMAMQATMEAMVDGILPADEQRLLMLNNEVVRLGKLVDALLKLSRLENRSNPLNVEELDLGQTISELALSHQMFVEESGLAFQYSAEPDIIVMADPDLIKQATANILSNAVRYTPEGGRVSIEVTADQAMAHIAVSDTGIGLSPDDITHIFSRFWRADTGRERSSGGLGIGLALVKEIVDRHGGWVDVESVEGQGSTFTINIPLVQDEERKRARSRQDREKQGTLRWFFPARSREDREADGPHEAPAGDEVPDERKERPRHEQQRRERGRRERVKRERPVFDRSSREKDGKDKGRDKAREKPGGNPKDAPRNLRVRTKWEITLRLVGKRPGSQGGRTDVQVPMIDGPEEHAAGEEEGHGQD